MYEAVTTRFSLVVKSNLATKNVAKGAKGIVKFLVANGKVKVLNKNVSDT